MKNILAFGDSVLQGILVENEKIHVNPRRFTKLLEEKMDISIENKGQIGSTIARLDKAMERYDKRLQSPEYDTIVLLFGGNDSDFDWQAISDNPSDTHLCKTELEQFTRIYHEKINYLKSLGKQVTLLSLPPIDPEKYFRWISRGKDADAILSWLHGDVRLIMNWHEMFNLAVFHIAAMAGVPVLDISSCFLSRPNYTNMICEDGIHPNQEGHQLIADALALQISA